MHATGQLFHASNMSQERNVRLSYTKSYLLRDVSIMPRGRDGVQCAGDPVDFKFDDKTRDSSILTKKGVDLEVIVPAVLPNMLSNVRQPKLLMSGAEQGLLSCRPRSAFGAPRRGQAGIPLPKEIRTAIQQSRHVQKRLRASPTQARDFQGPDALLFDCDGVLVDTEAEGHRIAFNKAFKQKGNSS